MRKLDCINAVLDGRDRLGFELCIDKIRDGLRFCRKPVLISFRTPGLKMLQVVAVASDRVL